MQLNLKTMKYSMEPKQVLPTEIINPHEMGDYTHPVNKTVMILPEPDEKFNSLSEAFGCE